MGAFGFFIVSFALGCLMLLGLSHSIVGQVQQSLRKRKAGATVFSQCLLGNYSLGNLHEHT